MTRLPSPASVVIDRDAAKADDPVDPAVRSARAVLGQALLLTGAEDRDAFRDVYRLSSAKLFGICLHICGERSGAEDVLHDVYLIVWKRAAAWDPHRGTAMTWLSTLARNRAIDWRRAQSRQRTAPIDTASDVIDAAVDLHAALESDEALQYLHHGLARLEARDRKAIVTAFFGGVTYAELAAQSNVPLGTMKSRMRRSLARLGRDLPDPR